MYRWLLITLILLTLIAMPATSAAQSAPATAHFGTGIILLESKAGWFSGKLSPDGRYVVGTSWYANSVRADNHLSVWDLAQVAADGPPRALDPVVSRPFSDFMSDESSVYGWLALSPDGTLVAIVLKNKLYLLDVPALTMHATYTLSPEAPARPGHLGWSADGSVLSIAGYGSNENDYDTHVIIIEPGLDVVNEFDTVPNIETLRPFRDGWAFYDTNETFTTCTARLDACTTYPLRGYIAGYDPINDVLITGSRHRYDPILAWAGPDFDSLTPDATLYAYLGGFGLPDSFSPTGRYYTVCWQGTGYYPGWVLWDIEQHRLLHSAGFIRAPMWLGMGDYFLHGKGMNLGHPTQAEWLDTLPEIVSIPFVSETGETVYVELWQMYHELVGIYDISADGTHYLLGLGNVALVVPVIYE
ncbi:MAG: hypothetical protein JXJ20_09280 [Anaerolineae bacterium]|nr:hypothetical protein [Anaerolineae bacterium]